MTKPEGTLRALAARGITHVVGIPDRTSAPLFDMVRRHPGIRLVTATREGEAFGIATGLWIGGADPLVVIEDAGLLESGASLRGTAQRMAVPMPVIVTGPGYATDAAAVLTEPTLHAWGVPFRVCRETDDPSVELSRTIDEARDAECPVALVVARGLD